MHYQRFCFCFCSWNDTSEASAIAFDFALDSLLAFKKLLKTFRSSTDLARYSFQTLKSTNAKY